MLPIDERSNLTCETFCAAKFLDKFAENVKKQFASPKLAQRKKVIKVITEQRIS